MSADGKPEVVEAKEPIRIVFLCDGDEVNHLVEAETFRVLTNDRDKIYGSYKRWKEIVVYQSGAILIEKRDGKFIYVPERQVRRFVFSKKGSGLNFDKYNKEEEKDEE